MFKLPDLSNYKDPITWYNVSEFKSDCYLFNTIASNNQNITKAKIKAQLDLIQEELKETYEALESLDNTKLLDGYCDIMVTTFGLGQQLEVLGMDIDRASRATAENNLDKYIWEEEEPELALEAAKASVLALQAKGVDARYEFNSEYQCYVIKDDKNKVRKPLTFVSNDLSEFVKETINYA